MRSNISKLYVTNFLTGFVFWYGIEKLFMLSIGISTVGIALNAVVYIAVSLVFNIPSGILADRWNRKYTLVLGIIFLAISSFLMGKSHSLPLYLFATAIWGLYGIFTSGTYQAMTYDSLHELGREGEYVKQQGRSYGMFLVGVALSSVIGGYIAHRYGYRASYLLSIIPCALNIAVLLSMREPQFHKDIEVTKVWQHLKNTYRLITAKQLLLYLSLMYITLSVLNNSQNEFSGLYFIALGLGAIGNGWANAGKWLSGSFGQFLANKIGKYTRQLIPVFFIFFIIFTIWHSPYGLIFFYLASFTQAVTATNIEGTIQKNTPSNIRATTLSFLYFVRSLILIPLSLVFGVIAKTSVFHAYLFVALIGMVLLAVWSLRPAGVRNIKIQKYDTKS